MKKNLILFLAILFLNLLSRWSVSFSSWYTQNISRLFVNTIGRLTDIFPFSLFEWIVIALVLGFIFILWKYRSVKLLMRYLLILCLIFTLTTGINYNSSSITEKLGFSKVEYTVEDLKNVCESLTVTLENIEIVEPDIEEIHAKSKIAMNRIIPGYYPDAKPMLFSNLMTRCGLSGIFSPFTIEANYNKDMPLYNKPFTICHELSHLSGYMSEDEANFIAYLACIQSDHGYFNYSGTLTAFIYVTNELYDCHVDTTVYYERLPEKVIQDIKANNLFWNRYGDTLSNITNTVNDTYLKMNSVSEGVESYSLFVELLVSYYKTNHML